MAQLRKKERKPISETLLGDVIAGVSLLLVFAGVWLSQLIF